jgi:hypothetical protein
LLAQVVMVAWGAWPSGLAWVALPILLLARIACWMFVVLRLRSEKCKKPRNARLFCTYSLNVLLLSCESNLHSNQAFFLLRMHTTNHPLPGYTQYLYIVSWDLFLNRMLPRC